MGILSFAQMPPLTDNTTAPTIRVSFEADGTTRNGSGVWAALSDRRLKHDIRQIDNALDVVTRLRGVMFNWKHPTRDREAGRIAGFIAQEVEAVRPQWVKTGADGMKQIETVGMDALLVESIKEQQPMIEALQRRLHVLEQTCR